MPEPLYDAVIIGAGAAGLYCAGIAGQRGLKVLVIDHAERVAEKIRISGGGRCNFTNLHTTPANYLSANPDFCRSALARHTPADFIALVKKHGIAFHEKHKGQLFCDDSAEQIIRMLLDECAAGQVERWQPCSVQAVRALETAPATGLDGGTAHGSPDGPGRADARFALQTSRGPVRTRQVVIATGGPAIPKIGASDWGHRLARQFGHAVVEPRPALVPLTFAAADWAPFVPLAGASLEVRIQAEAPPPGAEPGRKPGGGGGKRQRQLPPPEFTEDLLFTHRGLSGPAVLQASSYWQPGGAIRIDLAPGQDLEALLREAKARSRRQLGNELAALLPARLAEAWLARLGLDAKRPMPEVRDKDLSALAQSLQAWRLTPDGSEGWRKAEVAAGGVDTRELDSRHLGSLRQPGLHFIGEVADVTGWLGGYNFQWAWTSAAACAQGLQAAQACGAA